MKKYDSELFEEIKKTKSNIISNIQKTIVNEDLENNENINNPNEIELVLKEERKKKDISNQILDCITNDIKSMKDKRNEISKEITQLNYKTDQIIMIKKNH